MRTITIPLVLVSLYSYGAVKPIVGTARSNRTGASSNYTGATRTHSISARPTCTEAGWPLRADYGGMQTGGFCSQRRQGWCWDHGRLHPANCGGDATTSARHQASAAN